jgi:hypothetical protein
MMCGRVECLPRDCEVIGIVPPIGADPDYTTAMSDVYKTVDGSRIVALKRIRAASRPENEKVRKVRRFLLCGCLPRMKSDERTSPSTERHSSGN